VKFTVLRSTTLHIKGAFSDVNILIFSGFFLKLASKQQKTLNKPVLQFSSPKNVVNTNSEETDKFEEYLDIS
jgi:hypothetical protein